MRTRVLVVVVALSVGSCARAPLDEVRADRADTGERAIVNGQAYSVSNRPSAMALVGEFSGFAASFCSATLVAPDAVITAAHCVDAIADSVTGQGGTVYVSGAADFTSGSLPSDAILASDWTFHPSWNLETNPTPDVGLVFLAEASATAPMAVLRTSEDAHLRSGQEVELVGWGLQTPGGSDSGEKRGTTVLLQIVTPQLLFYGTPLVGVTTRNKCNGDSGGPTFLDVDGVVRVIGIASRSDCQNGTIDTRADAFVDYFDDELSARCNNGSRVSCAIPGLPTAAQLGAGTLPSPASLGSARRLPDALEGPLLDAGAHVGSCFGYSADEGVGFIYVQAFGLGAGACDASDVSTGIAYYECMASADCNDIGSGFACSSEGSTMQSALACTDLTDAEPPPVGGVFDDMSPELQGATADYCARVIGCGLTAASQTQCQDEVAGGSLAEYVALDCNDVDDLMAGWLECLAGASCDAIANEQDPNGCSATVTQQEFDAAVQTCNGGGEGEGEGEGEGGEGEGEGEGGEGEGDGGEGEGGRADDDLGTSPGSNCASAPLGTFGTFGTLAACAALLRRRRVR